MNKTRLLLIAALLLVFATGRAGADEVSELKQQLAEQRQLLLKIQQRLEQLEVKQKQQSQTMEQKISEVVEQKQIAALPDSFKWVENVKLFGDLRYRHESIDDTDTGSDKRNRNRIRARFGLKAKVNDELDAIFRLASGSSDTPTSTNQTLGDTDSDSFSSKEIWLDWAYFDWHPKTISRLNVFGGKMANPFFRVGGNELIWDGDVAPEGIAARYTFDLEESTTATLNGAGFWLAERSGDADASFWGLQGYVKHKFEDGSHLLGGATYYDLGNVDDTTLSGVALNGNTDNGSGGYEYDFDLIEGFVEYGFTCGQMPVAVFGNYIENTAAPENRNTAYSVGFKLNKIKKPGSWQFGYLYRDVESDAVFGGLTDSDFILGGSGGKGHEIGFKYQLAKSVQGALTYFINDRDSRTSSGTEDVKLFQADLIFKF